MGGLEGGEGVRRDEEGERRMQVVDSKDVVSGHRWREGREASGSWRWDGQWVCPSDGGWEHEVPGHLWGWCPWGSEADSYPTQPSTPFLLSHPIVAQFSEPPKLRPVGFCWKAGVNQLS